ncbi:uncharacterized protein LOC113495044 isoform X3 [Trichoplusia ni]|uniref:Uncharacterized protein LOC113495044 isoform X3 n=1 Tax=Trichoplusia ni TaxID=7111 RepID=A0A7E5VM70_TRINI|nr:uncharacterized protein LOC113495044 isoform X3 [Trichoplusia ni]
MSNNKKESLKKTLGISEYPWSSDDEDNTNIQPAQEANAANSVRRQSSESRPSSRNNNNTAEMNGGHHSLNGGGQVSPTVARKQQNKLDRTLFWSIINTGRTSPPASSRYTDPNLPRSAPQLRSSSCRETRPAIAEHPAATADIQRILAFKKLTRSLQNFAHKPNHYLNPARRLSAGASSRTLFGSHFGDQTRRNNSSRSNLHRLPLTQYMRSRHHNGFFEEPEVSPSTSVSDVNEVLSVEDPQPSSSGIQFRSIQQRQNGSLDTTQTLPDHHYVNVDQSDDDVEAGQQSAPVADHSDENNADDENAEGTTPNTSAGGISLEEEIVEVDVAEETDAAPNADAEPDTADVNITTVNAATPNPEEAAETPRPPSLKRKRDSNDETAEPYSVHEFNQCKHLPILKIGRKHKFSMKVNTEQHDNWVIMALDEYFHLRVDVDIRTWGVIVYVAFIGPKRRAKNYTYEVLVQGQHNARSLKYSRATHSDLESSSLNVSRQDCFHLTLDQALNFLRFKNRHCEPDKFLDFDVEISKNQNANLQDSKDDSE